MSRQPRLFDCTTESLVKSMLDAAELGLEPSGLMGQAYLVPFRNSRTNTYEATLIVGYRGLAELARRSGQVANVEARVVRARDDFAVEYGTSPRIHHVPYIPGLMGAPAPGADDAPVDGAGPFLAAYAVLTLKDASRVIDVMSAAEVDAIRKRSRSKDDGPWVTDYQEMARKSVLRRALKWAPVSVVDARVAEVLDAEDRAQFGPSGDPGQAAVQVATAAPAAITAAAAAFRLGATGLPPAYPQDAVDQASADFQAAAAQPDVLQDARQAAQEAPGGPEGPEPDPVDPEPPSGGPGSSTGKGDGSFTASPAIGVKLGGKATGKAGPARCPSTTRDGTGCALAAGHDLPHQGWDSTWVNPEDQPSSDNVDRATGEVLDAGNNAMVACEAPSPYGDGQVCLMPKGHRGAHRGQEGTW